MDIRYPATLEIQDDGVGDTDASRVDAAVDGGPDALALPAEAPWTP